MKNAMKNAARAVALATLPCVCRGKFPLFSFLLRSGGRCILQQSSVLEEWKGEEVFTAGSIKRISVWTFLFQTLAFRESPNFIGAICFFFWGVDFFYKNLELCREIWMSSLIRVEDHWKFETRGEKWPKNNRPFVKLTSRTIRRLATRALFTAITCASDRDKLASRVKEHRESGSRQRGGWK